MNACILLFQHCPDFPEENCTTGCSSGARNVPEECLLLLYEGWACIRRESTSASDFSCSDSVPFKACPDEAASVNECTGF